MAAKTCQLLPWSALLLVAVFAATWPSSAPGAEPTRPPNIVLIVADDLGHADISLHGCKDIATPHIDSLAQQGVRCSNGYVSCPYCSPTRAGLLTGRYQQRFGHEFNPQLLSLGGKGQGLPTGETTLPQRLKEAGYATALLGKWHLGEEAQFHPLQRGFSEFFGFLPGSHSYLVSNDPTRGPVYRGRDKVELQGYLTEVLAKEAVGFIDRQQKSPFFLCLTFNAVHTPLESPPALLKKFAAIEDPTRRTYAAMTAALDDAVGVVLDKLRSANLEERTLVVFISDNGGPIGKFAPNGSRNAPLRGSKGDTWEGGIRVPFLARWKGKLPAGKVYEQPVIQLDLHATALAAAGIALKPEWKLDGVNLLPFLEGKDKSAPHAALYWRFGEQMAIRMGDWKLVRADLTVDKQFGDIAKKPMLFNLAADIGEQKDLAEAQPEKVKELTSLWEKWNRELAPPAWQHHALQKPAKP
jgi:arylsulfatase A-like enzyme